jgi:hypothetical protein
LPASATSAVLEGRHLRLPPVTLASVAVLGDTGCRLKASKKAKAQKKKGVDDHGGDFQDCDSTADWPFSTLAASIAGKAPQLVVHVGDYLYRESPCPKGDDGCKGSPYGDNWPTWQADFFKPAAPLLASAPWIATRGNHEDCGRAGDGFMLFLDTTSAQNGKPPACADLLPAFTATAGGQSFFVMDTSDADDSCDPCNSQPYAQQFASANAAPGTWFVSHKPIWGFNNKASLNATLQGALAQWQGKLPPGFTLAVGGHIHLWEVLGFADQRTPQFVIGNGGTKLDKAITSSLKGKSIGGTTVSYGATKDKFGYTIFRPASGTANWAADYYSAKGNEKLTCTASATAVSCQ